MICPVFIRTKHTAQVQFRNRQTKIRSLMIAFVSSPHFVDHYTGSSHPERPDRIRAIYRALRTAGMIDSPDPFPEFQLDLGIRPHSAVKLLELSPEPASQKWLRLVHTPRMIDWAERVCRIGGGILDQGDTVVGPDSFEIALLSLGAAMAGCDAVLNGKARRAFVAARPPGHHAEPDRSMGFCIFCNIAIAAKYAQQTYGVEKIAIVDFDVHHGNGTQAAFEADPSVLFISLHQHPRTIFPGTGYETETGTGKGEGFTINIPMNPGSEDEDYMKMFQTRVVPALDKFRPQLVMVSAGFDAHRDDPLAQINLSDECFEWMTRQIVDVAEQHCGGRIVSVLEGGYNLQALGRCVVRHVLAMQC